MGSRSSVELALLCTAAARRSLATDLAAMRLAAPSGTAAGVPVTRDGGSATPVH